MCSCRRGWRGERICSLVVWGSLAAFGLGRVKVLKKHPDHQFEPAKWAANARFRQAHSVYLLLQACWRDSFCSLQACKA